MEKLGGTCEIVEAEEEFTFESRMNEKVKRHSMPRQGHLYSVEEGINRLFDSVNIKASLKAEVLHRNPMKRPIRVNTPQSMGFGTSESVNMKQALRGLCISQASGMAAMKKRSLKSAGSSRNSDVRIENQIDEGKRNLIEISSPGKITANITKKIPESVEVSARDSLNKSFRPPKPSAERPVTKTKMARVPSKDSVVSLLSESASEKSNEELVEDNKPKLTVTLRDVCTIRSILEADDLSSPSVDAKFATGTKIESNTIVNVKGRSRSRSMEKGEFSQSSNSSIGEYSSSTSEESSSSGCSRCFYRPHMSKDSRWDSIQSVQKNNGFLSLGDFRLLRRLGSGDIGTVYLAELVGTNCLFAIKVMDNEFLARRKKLDRAQTEREILQMLDHPFLPTLYAHFTTDKLSCLAMEYCPGGDLHVFRQKQPNRCFPEQAARFYVAEVLLALEYLHMLGVIYRDLKPENILVREDGHIMLTDFDLSLRCVVNPTLLTSSSPMREPSTKISSNISSESSCIGDPFCLQPSCQISCFSPRLLTTSSKTLKPKSNQPPQATRFPQLIAEPTEARSNSFVGTHEYLAPEIIKGEGHGSSVDWWTFGVFLYELLYGKTPFKGSSNEETLANVVSNPLEFPAFPLVSFHARDLIRQLLAKQPQNRLGSVRGTAEIKKHPFFEGLNWALVRCAVPPERPGFQKENGSEHIGFEVF